MKSHFSILALLPLLAGLLLSGCRNNDGGPDERSPYECVDPMIGTGFHGHTFPGATTPYGAVQLSPDTRSGDWDAAAGYHYSDSALYGFSHTHLSGTGCTDLGDVLLRPTRESLDRLLTRSDDDRRRSPGDEMHPATFSHKNEHAEPGFYSVRLDDGIQCDLTATAHCGLHRYAFGTKGEGTPSVVIDLAHLLSADDCISEMEMEQTAPNEVQGYRITEGWSPDRHTYFVARFSQPATKMTEGNIRGIMQLEFGSADTLVVTVGISQVSIEGAVRNLEAETGVASTATFDKTRKATAEIWSRALEKITVKGGTRDERTLFYTALYHTMTAPNLVSDADGQYRRADGTLATVPEGQRRYSTLSTWDTFRALHPLLTLTDSALVSDVCYSMLDWYDATGELPIWPLSSGETKCMIGYHSASILADAYLKGIWPAAGDATSAKRALNAMVRSSNINEKGSDYYIRDGYIPADRKRESVSCLLEYTYDDWCISAMAERMGETAVATEYRQRAANFTRCFDGGSRFFRGRRSDGNWSEGFDPYEAGRDYTEATAWQYRFGALHDVRGMVSLYGGKEHFRQALDSLFSFEAELRTDLQDITGVVGQYAHGNEPSHHMAYLYNYIGMPWETQRLTRQLLQTMYQPTPEGICGNEDCGQMSAWYVLTALGLYSVTPASLQYNLTLPLFEEATLQLDGGRKLVIRVKEGKGKTYIRRVTFSADANAPMPGDEAHEADLSANFIDHKLLAAGGALTFFPSDEPCKERGTAEDDAPFSLSDALAASLPYVNTDLNLFVDSVRLELGSATEGAVIHYTLDGTTPTTASPVYRHPMVLRQTTDVRAIAVKKGMAPSPVMSIRATRAEFLPASKAKVGANGCHYRYLEGDFHRTADLQEGIEKDCGVMPTPDISKALRPDHFGYVFEGFIDIPEQGVYGFSTTSDDGSVLYVDDRLVVDNDGGHAAVSASGRIALAAGKHRYRILYFEDYEGEAFAWAWQKPGGKQMEPIPAACLYTK